MESLRFAVVCVLINEDVRVVKLLPREDLERCFNGKDILFDVRFNIKSQQLRRP